MYKLMLLLLLAVPASAGPQGSFTVLVASPRIQFFSGDIAFVCGQSTQACAAMTGIAFHATCEQRDGEWEPRPAISFVPVVYLPAFAGPGETHRLIVHEFAHIRDLHRDTESYARALSNRQFDTPDRCRAAVDAEGATLAARIQSYAKQSVAVRK